jgi:nicotinate-nucleotide--dimethylbenzimidazole phosphoribosyltransferase
LSAGAGVSPVLDAAIAAVEPPDVSWSDRAAGRQARLTMPPGSLGRLLDIGRQLAAIQRTDRPWGHPAVVAVFAADHGVAAEGVSAYPIEVTGQMLAGFLRGGAAVNVLARRAGAEVRVVDLGVASPPVGLDGHPSFVSRPIGRGTANLLHGPAMGRRDAIAAVEAGVALGDRWARDDGSRVIALGEMGIGNSTTAAALVAALTGAPARTVVGPGTGVAGARLDRKREVIAAAIERQNTAAKLNPIVDLWQCLAGLGGFEILGLAGLAIAAARHRALVVLDGFISTTAGLVASRLCPAVRGSLLAAHLSPEPGHRIALRELGLTPLFDLGLRLGEGSGAALALPLIASAADILRDMATFESAGVAGPDG